MENDSSTFGPTDTLCINTIRTLAIDAIQKADSGHPGLPLGAAPMAYVLWQRHLKHDPKAPQWPDRDRFVLSAGHGCMLHYALLHLTGYPLSLDDLKSFRQWKSLTPGHPEFGVTPGIEATTGPLGQGHANAVGMAIAERALAQRFNRPGHTIVDHHTWALISDGDVMEGVACEAASLAGHLRLGKLNCIYDANDVTLDGPASLCFSEDVAARYRAYGWHVQTVERGDTDLAALDAAMANARAETSRPSLVVIKTTIGFGSPNKAGKSSSHGSPLGKDELALTKKALGWETETPFFIPEPARAAFRKRAEAGTQAHQDWHARFEAYARAFPDLAAEFKRVMAGKLPDGWDAALSAVGAEAAESRTSAGKALNAIALKVPEILGGDADLGGSTKTVLKDLGSFNGQSGAGRNIHFGVREHAMAAIANGIAYHRGLRPFTATFFCFSDYMRPSVRLAAINHLPVVHVWTHDSIGLGEDGPTHQPVEHLMALRTMPNLHVVRPCDGPESAQAWKLALERTDGPTGLVLSRQKLPSIDRTTMGSAAGLLKGGYTLCDASGPLQAIVIASGSEMSIALEAQKVLHAEGIGTRVVSLPCWERFAAQPQAYRDSVLPPQVRARASIEAGVTFGWDKWIGPHGVAVGVDRYGASAPAEIIFKEYGLTAPNLVAAVKQSLQNVKAAAQ